MMIKHPQTKNKGGRPSGSKSHPSFKRSDVARAIKAVQAATGLPISDVQIRRDGTIVVTPREVPTQPVKTPEMELEDWKNANTT